MSARFLLPLLALVASFSSAHAQSTEIEAERYHACLAAVQENAEAGFERARDWRIQGGGIPARHCGALALIQLQKFGTAAQMLEQIAQDMAAESSLELRVEVLAQAGQAWLMQGDTARAIAVQTAALRLAPDDAELMIDRALAHGGGGQYWEAIDDLNRAIELRPGHADALVYRASAYRLIEAPDLGLADVTEALRLRPDDPDALAERGLLRRLTGDDQGARQDWLRVVRAGATVGAAFEIARSNLEKLDFKVETAPSTPASRAPSPKPTTRGQARKKVE